MVAFIELPCNLHFAPLGLPARAPPVLGGVHRSAFFDWAQWRRKIPAGTERRSLGSPAGPAAPLVSPLVILHEVAALAVRHAGNGRRRLAGVAARWRSDSRTQRR